MKSRPLDGLLVIALEQAVAAPACTARLAAAGARVIKIERPEGDFARGYDGFAAGGSSYFAWLNQGKESIALDLKEESERGLLARMLAKADIFVQNLAPGAAARLGFSLERLRALHPRLITLSISGYGESGPYAGRKAYDLLVQAESGLASVTGRPEGPGRVGVSVCDIATGLSAYSAVLEALLLRGRTGEGAALTISLFDAMAEWMTVPFLQRQSGAPAPQRVGLAHPSIAPYGVFPCLDGEVLISIQNEREWESLVRHVLAAPALLEDVRFADNKSRVAHRALLDGIIATAFAALDRKTLSATLDAAAIAYGFVNRLDDLLAHPQLRLVTIDTPEGRVTLPAPPVIWQGLAPESRPVPALNQQGAALRAEFAATD